MSIDNDQNSGGSSFFNWSGASGVTQSGANKYPNPFCDIASEYVPRDINAIFEWTEYLMLAVVPFRTVSQRVVRYFLTEIVLEGQSDDEREKYEDFLNNQLHILQQFAEVGDDYMCFHGDTKVPTRNGVYSIRELAGKTVDVISQGGVYRKADFKAFGRQELLEVTFSDGRKVRATPEHEWIVLNCSSKKVVVPTSRLHQGYRIERTVAPRPERGEEYREGVRHGFVFGDGSKSSKNRTSAYFCGKKDEAVIPFFVGFGKSPKHDVKRNLWYIGGLPGHYKTLPANDASAEYWYGFVSGFLAADGTVDTHGCALLTQASKHTLEAIEAQLPRIGMCAGPIRAQQRTTDLRKYSSGPNKEVAVYDSTIHYMTLLKRFMRIEDFLIESHITKFAANKHDTNYGRYIDIESVVTTGITDEVFCCVEMDTHTFVIENGILTKQCYGNVFISIFFPFDRYLICPECYTNYHVNTVNYRFDRSRGTFKGRCEKCDKEDVEFKREDRRSPDTSRVRIIRWNPKRMRLRVHPVSGRIEYYMQMDADFVRKVLEGIPFYLNETPWAMIQACLKTDKQRKQYYFKFKDDAIYHLRSGSLAGLPVRGWAIPPILPNFKLAYYVQLLRRYDEAIALDFIIPFRVLFPKNQGPQGQDALSTLSMGTFVSAMSAMVQRKRKNITDVQIAPFEVGYEMLGGEAKSLAPKDNIALAMDELLNSMGFPAELYKGTLSIQAFPVALRLFEKQWNSLVDGFNDLLSWMLKRLGRHFMWGEVSGTLRSVTLADDIERKALSMQAAAGRDISKQTAYRPLGIDYLEEQKRVAEEQETIQRLQQEAQERQQAQAQQGGSEGGGSQAGATPGDVEEQAQALAQQLLTQVPETQRRGELIKIKRSNPTLHALVIAAMTDMRQQAASQGQAQVLEQMKQGSALVKFGSAECRADQIPSPTRIGLLVSSELSEYGKDDMRKIAVDIGRNVKGAERAFHFVFYNMMGWEL